MSKYINLAALKQFLIGLRNAFDCKVLYNNPMALWNYGESTTIPTSFSTVTLNDNFTNYKRLIIEAVSNEGVYTTVTIINPIANKSFNIWDWYVTSDYTVYLKILSCKFSTTTTNIIAGSGQSGQKTIQNNNTQYTAGVFFKITKVIGYKH